MHLTFLICEFYFIISKMYLRFTVYFIPECELACTSSIFKLSNCSEDSWSISDGKSASRIWISKIPLGVLTTAVRVVSSKLSNFQPKPFCTPNFKENVCPLTPSQTLKVHSLSIQHTETIFIFSVFVALSAELRIMRQNTPTAKTRINVLNDRRIVADFLSYFLRHANTAHNAARPKIAAYVEGSGTAVTLDERVANEGSIVPKLSVVAKDH